MIRTASLLWIAALLVLAACAQPSPSSSPAAKLGEACGTAAAISCESTLWCDYQGACGGVDLAGVCSDAPAMCPMNWDPVCGCDGKTYGNDCGRQGARVQKAHKGECDSET